MQILAYISFFLVGVAVGALIKTWLVRHSSSRGILYVITRNDKTLYSLELEDYPESIRFKKTVIFKVEESDRE